MQHITKVGDVPGTSRREPILIFDGDCGFCTTSAGVAQRLRRRQEDYAVVAYQFADLDSLGLTEEACAQALQWVDAAGRISSAERAIAEVLRHGRWWVRPLGEMLRVPPVRRLAGVIYRWVARNRHRLPGGTAVCSLRHEPPPLSNG